MGQTCVQYFGSISNSDCVMSVERVKLELMFLLLRIPNCQLIQSIQMFLVDCVVQIADKLYPPLHACDAFFHFVRRSVASKNPTNTFTFVINSLDLKSSNRLVLHGFLPEGSA